MCARVRVSLCAHATYLAPTGLVSFSRARAALADPRAAVFMCTVDVLNCFDSLKHGPVLAVLEELLSKSEYNIQHYARADVDADGNVIRIHRAEKVRGCQCVCLCVYAAILWMHVCMLVCM